MTGMHEESGYSLLDDGQAATLRGIFEKPGIGNFALAGEDRSLFKRDISVTPSVAPSTPKLATP
jgi:hypothetical protein